MQSHADLFKLYPAHLAALRAAVEEALAASGFDALLIHSGVLREYFSDDQEIPFRPNPYFAHVVPLREPHALIFIAPGRKPILIRVKLEDFWRERAELGEPFWISEFDFKEVPDTGRAWSAVPKVTRLAYVSDDPDEAKARGIADDAANPASVLARLDLRRSFKTPYEIACIEEANHLAAHAHDAARGAFLDGASEYEIHHAYLDELGVLDHELPYETVVALDEKAAILHYQGKRLQGKGTVLLLDAGASYLGYASDITRTYVYEDECDVLFRGLVGGVETIEQELVAMAKPGRSFPELHHAAHEKLGELMHSFGILKLPAEKAVERGFTRAFFPHGLGHFLGINVHDVGGNQKGPAGGAEAPPAEYPALRMTRVIEEGMVFTVEPGLYFIEMLLAPFRSGENAKYFDWPLINRLKRLGGIRIEDDIVATKGGNRNLTRAYL